MVICKTNKVFRLCSFFTGTDTLFGTVSAVGVFIGEYRVKFSSAQGGLINAQKRAHVLREDKPILGMPGVSPLGKATRMMFVSPFKLISIDRVKPLKRATRDRVLIQQILLKKPRTPSSSGYLCRSTTSPWKHSPCFGQAICGDVHEVPPPCHGPGSHSSTPPGKNHWAEDRFVLTVTENAVISVN